MWKRWRQRRRIKRACNCIFPEDNGPLIEGLGGIFEALRMHYVWVCPGCGRRFALIYHEAGAMDWGWTWRRPKPVPWERLRAIEENLLRAGTGQKPVRYKP